MTHRQYQHYLMERARRGSRASTAIHRTWAESRLGEYGGTAPAYTREPDKGFPRKDS